MIDLESIPRKLYGVPAVKKLMADLKKKQKETKR